VKKAIIPLMIRFSFLSILIGVVGLVAVS